MHTCISFTHTKKAQQDFSVNKNNDQCFLQEASSSFDWQQVHQLNITIDGNKLQLQMKYSKMLIRK